MYDNTMTIKDYVTLFLNEGTLISTGIYEWQIPSTYYTDQRSTVCTVSVVGANIASSGTHTNILIEYSNGGNNIYSKDNNTYVIAHCQHESTGAGGNSLYKAFPQEIELLTTARPQVIRLRFLTGTKGVQAMDNGCITLKYCYYNSEHVNKDLHNQYTNTLK